mmetsp:Transcript_4667/g.6912  ORF Transcript_4667/g.6912 Transcript_4667/m.6912 type:complete len:114 (+) Transcript_4667:212-553(+)
MLWCWSNYRHKLTCPLLQVYVDLMITILAIIGVVFLLLLKQLAIQLFDHAVILFFAQYNSSAESSCRQSHRRKIPKLHLESIPPRFQFEQQLQRRVQQLQHPVMLVVLLPANV